MALTVKDLLIQQLIPQSPIERLDEGFLCRFARLDVVPGDTPIALLTEDRTTGQLRAVTADDRLRLSIEPDHRIEFAAHAMS